MTKNGDDSPQTARKLAAAAAAIDFLPAAAREGWIGIGSGSTVNAFIDLLAQAKIRPAGIVAASIASESRLAQAGYRPVAAYDAPDLDVVIDGADEVDPHFRLIKGGGGAHAREKVLAASTRVFVCLVDDSKLSPRLGIKSPLPVETLPMARSFVARRLAARGGSPRWREGFTTDNGNWILDTAGLDLLDPAAVESEINAIPGVVENGLFARRPADVLIVAARDGIEIKKRAAQ